jgi:hypothetical protein
MTRGFMYIKGVNGLHRYRSSRARGVFLPLVHGGSGDLNTHHLVSNYNMIRIYSDTKLGKDP